MTDSLVPERVPPTAALLGSFLALGIPVGAVAFSLLPGPGQPLLWFMGVVPMLVWAHAHRWRGLAIATAVVLGAVLLTHATLAPASDGAPELLPGVLLVMGGIAVGVGWITERIGRDHGRAENLALTDAPTGLPNRRHALVFLETMFGAAERGRPVAVVLFDIDHLKSYNEGHGRAAGDAALRAFAELLDSSTRRMNLSARIGGEEFLTILAGADVAGAHAFANRIRETFSVTRLTRGGLTVSAGVAVYHPSMREPDELVAAADLALFRAKDEGRDRVRVFGRDTAAAHGSSASVGEPGAKASDRSKGGDYPRADEDIGRTAPSVNLLPPPGPQFGAGRRVLLVEPDGETERVVSTYLGSEGFGLELASTPSAAVQSLDREFDAVITDLELPGLSGTELVKAVKSRWPATQVLVVTDAGEASLAAEALSAGADRYLERPVSLPILQAHLIDALRRLDRLRGEQEERRRLAQEAHQRPDGVRKAVVRAALTLVRAGELRDPFLQGHSRRMTSYALEILDATGAPGEEVDRDLFRLACLVHDVGMIEVPEAILRKPEPLTAEEFERVRRHPETGRRLLEVILQDEPVLDVASWHHERWDGSGYPDALAGRAIPWAARIAAIADALDAMTSPRAHRSALAWEDAVRQVPDRAGTHFDPGLIEAFQAALPRLEERFRGFASADDPEEGGAVLSSLRE